MDDVEVAVEDEEDDDSVDLLVELLLSDLLLFDLLLSDLLLSELASDVVVDSLLLLLPDLRA